MKTKKRWISMLLAVCLLGSSFSVSAMPMAEAAGLPAEETQTTEQTEAAGQTEQADTVKSAEPMEQTVDDAGEAAHTHSWSTEWSSDETAHWHECTAEGCPITDNASKDGYEVHTFDQKTVSDVYKAEAGDGSSAVLYYYSCVCGKKGTETFAADEGENSGNTDEDAQIEEDADPSELSSDDPDAEEDGIMLLSEAEPASGDVVKLAQFTIANRSDDSGLLAIYDGTGPFDTDETGANAKNIVGNDENDHNGKVRSFDSINYTLSYQTVVTGTENSYSRGTLCFEFLLPCETSVAEWDTSAMMWMQNQKITTETRTYDFDGDGTEETVSCQVLRGTRDLVPSPGSDAAIPGSGTLSSASVQVLAAQNGTKITPVFTAWLDGNCTGSTSLTGSDTQATGADPCATHNTQEQITICPDPITVTAAPRYNIQLVQGDNSYSTSISTFNFNEGNDLALDKDAGESIYGICTSYGVTLQLRNLDGDDGLKGIEYPTGAITFDVEFSASYALDDGGTVDATKVMSEYTPLVLSWGEMNNNKPADGRTLTDFSAQWQSPVYAGPYNSGMTAANLVANGGTGSYSCYEGGDWAASVTDASQANTSAKRTLTFTVSNYQIQYPLFPNARLGNNTLATYYFDRTLGVDSTGVGCFSAGKFFIVVPLVNADGEGIADDYGNGQVKLNVKAVNLQATSVSNQTLDVVSDNSNQTVKSDDNLNVALNLRRNGNFNTPTAWTSASVSGPDHRFNDVLGRYTGDDWSQNGLDTLTAGSAVAVGVGLANDEQSDAANRIYAADAIVKFDAESFTVTGNGSRGSLSSSTSTWSLAGISPGAGTSTSQVGLSINVLYGVRSDGLNWDSDDQMNKAKIEDLNWYSSLSDAQTDGKKVVACLVEWRPSDPDDLTSVGKFSYGLRSMVKIKGKLSGDASTVGKVYQEVVGYRVWKRADYKAALDAELEKDASYTGCPVPTMKGDGTNESTGTYPETPNKAYRSYTKVAYNDDGGYVSGHSGLYYYGDSLRIVGVLASIQKSVAQTVKSDDDVTSAKKDFLLDYEERTVDFALTSQFTDIPTGLEDATTNVTITDVLDDDLTYIYGSAYLGGTYTQGKNSLGYVGQGSVTGGEQVEPEVTKNDDGITTLTWKLENVKVSDGIPTIYYSAEIGTRGDEANDVSDGDTLTNTAYIRTSGDGRDYATTTGNMATATIQVWKQKAVAVAKFTEGHQRYFDVGERQTHNLIVSNNGTNAWTDAVVMESLPYDGDEAGSSFTGSYQVKQIEFSDTDLPNAGEWTCYYSTSDAAKGTISSDYEAADIRNGSSTLTDNDDNTKNVMWTKATITSETAANNTTTYTVTDVPSNGTVTAVVFVGDIASSKVFRAKFTTCMPESLPGDVAVNMLSRGDDTITTRTYTVNRLLSGLPWLDANADGVRDDDETVLSGVKVRLMKKTGSGSDATYEAVKGKAVAADGTVADDETELAVQTLFGGNNGADVACVYKVAGTNADGDPVTYTITATAKVDGSYEFSGLPDGDFAVEFSSGTGDGATNLAKYTASPVKAAAATDSTNSDGVAAYVDAEGNVVEVGADGSVPAGARLTTTVVSGIDMPAAANMSSASYASRYHDSGFYYAGKTLGDEAEFTLAKTLTGASMAKDQFNFEIKAVEPGGGAEDTSADLAGRVSGMDATTKTLTVSAPSGAVTATQGSTGATPAANADAVMIDALKDVTFTTEDVGKTFAFEISEKNAGVGGFTYDGTVYTVTVAPTWNDTDGFKLNVTVASTNGTSGQTAGTAASKTTNGVTAYTLPFANSYRATGTATLSASKTLTGREQKAGEFSFTVKYSDDTALISSAKTTANANSGKSASINFGTLTFTTLGTSDAGYESGQISLPEAVYNNRATTGTDNDGNPTWTFNLTISEDGVGTDGSITNIDGVKAGETRSFAAKIVVTDNGAGKLTTDVTYPNGAAAFQNDYNVEQPYSTAAKLAITKKLTGRNMTAGEFTLLVTPQAGAAPSGGTAATALEAAKKLDANATTAAAKKLSCPAGTDGAAVNVSEIFKDVTFTTTDSGKTFTWEVKEDLTGITPNSQGKYVKDGVTYDASVYTVSITPVDQKDGTIDITTVITKDGKPYGGTNDDGTYTWTGSSTASSISLPFENSYEATGSTADAALKGKKTVVDENGSEIKPSNYAQNTASYLVGFADYSGFTFSMTGSTTDANETGIGKTTAQAITDGEITLAQSGGGSSWQVTTTADGSFDFGTMTFQKPGTYTFTVVESNSRTGSAWTKTNEQKTVVITVKNENATTTALSDNPNGKLTATVAVTGGGISNDEKKWNGDATNDLTFTNFYHADPTSPYTVQVKKIVTGQSVSASTTFDFTMTPASDDTDGTDLNMTTAEAVARGYICNKDGNAFDTQNNTIANYLKVSTSGAIAEGGTQTLNFPTLTFTHAGTYTFYVKETSTAPDESWIYDNHTYVVKLRVSDNGSGTLLVSQDKDKSSTGLTDEPLRESFTNSYKSTTSYGAQGGLSVQKQLTGAQLNAGDFTFKITPANNASKAKLAAASDGKAPDADGAVTFQNSGENAVTGKSEDKCLLGLTFDQTDMGKTYTFYVNEVIPDDATNINVGGGKTLYSAATDEQKKTAGWTDAEGYTYDSETATVKIEVGQNGRTAAVTGDGDSVVFQKDTIYTVTTVTKGAGDSKTYSSENGVVTAALDFSNSYTASGVLQPTAISATKTLTGRDLTNADTAKFLFAVRSAQEDEEENLISIGTIEKVTGGDDAVVAKDGTAAKITFAEVVYTTLDKEKDKDAFEAFEAEAKKTYGNDTVVASLPYDARTATSAGSSSTIARHHTSVDAKTGAATDYWVYNYSITEAEDGLPKGVSGVSGKVRYEIAVTVTNNHDGTLSVTTAMEDGKTPQLAFENTYVPEESAPLSLKVQKSITGVDSTTEEFGFTLVPADGATTKKALDAGNITGMGKLDTDGDGTADTWGEQISTSGTKLVSGAATSFTFGNTLVFKQATPEGKPYVFTITEKDLASAGDWTKDSHAVTVEVTVTDQDAKLVATAVYKNTGAASQTDAAVTDAAAFTNVHPEASELFTPVAEKAVTGGASSGTFSFSIAAATDDEAYRAEGAENAVTTAQAAAAGSFTLSDGSAFTGETASVNYAAEKGVKQVKFDPLVFKKAGTYTFIVKETTTDAPEGWTYDSVERRITVQVTEEKTGATTVKLKAVQTAESTPQFVNAYQTSTTYGALGGLTIEKTLNGATLAEGQFAFEIAGADEASRKKLKEAGGGSVKNAAPGEDGTSRTPVLTALELTQEDVGQTYTYTVRETTASGDGFTCDDTVYTVAIEIGMDGGNKLTVTTTVTRKDDESYNEVYDSTKEENATVAFVNTYKAAGTLADLGITKTLTGRDMKDGEAFTFRLYAVNAATAVRGDELAKASVSELRDGHAEGVPFGAIAYINLSAKDAGYAALEAEAKGKGAALVISLPDAVENGNASYIGVIDGEDTWQLLYEAVEDTPADANTKASAPVRFAVTVTDDRDGTLTAAVTPPADALAFVNTYTPPESEKPTTDKTDETDKPTRSDASETDKVNETAVRTGDDSNLVLWIVLMCVGAAGIIGILLYRRKEKQHK